MNTLKEIGDFVGIPQGSLEVARFSGSRITSLGMVNLLVTGRERPATMRTIIQRLQNLTPITLEAQIVGDRSGEEPFDLIIRVNASGGITWHTSINYHINGNVHGGSDLNNSGGNFSIQLGAGSWQAVVDRSGISNTGFVSLSKTLDTITVSALPQPPPPPVNHPPDLPPTISATTEGAGDRTVLVVTGAGFLPNKTVTVRVVDDVFHERNFQQSSTPAGELKMRIPLPCNSGHPFHVSATDSRPSPGILGVLFSNNITLPCP